MSNYPAGVSDNHPHFNGGKVTWPDHPWAGDEHGHACAGCEEASPWYCDKVAHNLGENDRALRLLAAVEGSEP